MNSSHWNVAFTLILVAYAVLVFFVVLKAFKSGNRPGAYSSGVMMLFLVICAIYNHVFGLFLYPFNGFMIFWLGFCFIVLFGYVVLRKFKENRGLQTSPEREYQEENNEDVYHDNLAPKQELYRKMFHLAVLLMVLSYYGWWSRPATTVTNNIVIEFIDNLGSIYTDLWGSVDLYPYAVDDPRVMADLTFFALMALWLDLLIPDLIRIFYGKEYSIYNKLTHSVYRTKDLNSLGPQSFLLGSVTVTFLGYQAGLVSVEIVFIGALVACFGDAIAALIGKFYGRHKIVTLTGAEKSLEGFTAGILIAFVIPLFFGSLWFAIITALVFFLLDYFTMPISDNLLNPIIICLVLAIMPV